MWGRKGVSVYVHGSKLKASPHFLPSWLPKGTLDATIHAVTISVPFRHFRNYFMNMFCCSSVYLKTSIHMLQFWKRLDSVLRFLFLKIVQSFNPSLYHREE